MSIPEDGKQAYIEAYSHSDLAKRWGVSLISLDTYAEDQGWDREHRLYWQDRALEVLKKSMEEENVAAVKELLRVTGHSRPVGRPPKSEVQRHIAIEAKIANEYADDVARLASHVPLSVVK
ncbi:hypothetical protein [Luteibacter sp. CQ10]|uniref:hypothetical protein n=1 Tax=Luteibacter sp. CQ10 TaxID=2805821 RepID=UPI0034A15192